MYTVKIIIAIAVAFAAAVLLTSVEIPVLRKKQMGQNIREEGPKSHQAKAGTPSMGGVAIIISAALTAFIIGGINIETAAMVIVMAAFGLVGFLDDFIKVIKKHNLGLKAWQKIVFQFAIAAAIACWAAFATPDGTLVYIPFADIYVDFGGWYIPFIIFTVVAMTNSVNLTDGLDGLASSITTIVGIFFMLVSYIVFKEYGVTVFSAALIGGLIGFLWYNKYPAKVFMGDTGSLFLGASVALMAIDLKMPIHLILIGFVYFMETLSVIMQTAYFKYTKKKYGEGRRIFKMSPIHHHFEMCGWKEKKIVAVFTLVTVITCAVAYFAI